jgi:hypothetical protein
MVKFTAILATALMAVSATGISTSAQGVKQIEASKTANTSEQKSFKRYSKANETANLIALESKEAKPGEEISIPITTVTGNTCSCYNVVIEYDSRLEFVSAQGAQAFCDFEQNGIKYVSVVGYTTGFYTDGQAVATLNFRVPKDAENDNYFIKFNEITSFSTDTADYDDYSAKDAVVTVTGGKDKEFEGNCVQLKSVSGIAGQHAAVQVIPYSNNQCTCYDMLIEYDPALTLEDNGVIGANSFTIYEEDGRCFVAIVGYNADGVYKDGSPMATLNFIIPEDAMPGTDTFNVTVAKLSNFDKTTEKLPNVTYYDAVITVAEAYIPSGLTMFKTFMILNDKGEIVGTKVGPRGDFTNDGKTNVRDAAAIAKFIAGGKKGNASPEGLFFGIVNDKSKEISVRDAAGVASFVARGSKW